VADCSTQLVQRRKTLVVRITTHKLPLSDVPHTSRPHQVHSSASNQQMQKSNTPTARTVWGNFIKIQSTFVSMSTRRLQPCHVQAAASYKHYFLQQTSSMTTMHC